MKRVIVFALVLAMLAVTGTAWAETRILVGVNMELTGYSSGQGTEQYRGILAAHHIQPTFTVGDTTYRIEFSVCDNQTLREEAINCATRLAGESVVAVLGGFSSSMSIAAAPIYQERRLAQISTGATNPVLTQIGDYIFRIPFTDDFQSQTLAQYVYETLGARRVVIFRQADDDFSVGYTSLFQNAFQRLGGQVQVQSFNQAAVDFSPQLNNARRFNPDVLVNAAFCQLAGPLVRQSRAMGLDQPWVGGDSLDSPTCTELAGEAFEGVQFTGFPELSQLAPDALERAGAVQDAYFELYPSSVGFSGVTLAGSDAYGVIRAAIETAIRSGADPADVARFRVAVRDALASIEGYPGVTGDITYAGTEGTPANRSMGLLVVRNVLPDGRYERDSMGYFLIGPDSTVFYPHE